MKTFFMKVFLIIASALCMFEGLVLVAVGLGQLSSERLLFFYNRLLQAPKSLGTILGVGIFFVILGFTLLIVSSRTKPGRKMITIEKDGKALSVPQETVKSFVKQILEQNPYASDINVDLDQKEGWIDIRIAAAFNTVSSIHQEVSRIEEVLRNEINRVFEWKDFKFIFQLRGVSIDTQKKYFSLPDTRTVQPQDAKNQDTGVTEISPEEEAPLAEEVLLAKNKVKGKGGLKDKTLLSKILWGK